MGYRNKVVIRRAVRDDAGAIAAIHVASWQATYAGMVDDSALASLAVSDRLPGWERMLAHADPRYEAWVVEVDGVIAGFCSIGPSRTVEGAGELYTIYLAPRHVGQGLGHALLTQAEHRLYAQGYPFAMLWVLVRNLPARRFYARHGWTADGEEIGDEIFGIPVTELRYRKVLACSSSLEEW